MPLKTMLLGRLSEPLGSYAWELNTLEWHYLAVDGHELIFDIQAPFWHVSPKK